MTDLTSRLLVKLIDGVSGPARVAQRSLAALQTAGRATAALGGSKQMAAAGKAIVRNTREVAHTISGPMALIGAFGAKAAFEFEKAGNGLEALGDITGSQRKEFEQFANVLNAKYPQSLTEILRTGNELLKAGLDFKQMLGAIDPTLATAVLGEMKPSEVATMISAALNAFQMPKETLEQALKSTTTVSDRMTYAAVKSTATLRDMGEMFKYVAGAAAATGNGIDDVTAMALAFSANKINGSEAGVALRSAIVRMAKGGTKEGRAAMERSGLNFNDYMKGRQKVTSDRVIGGLTAGGIDAAPLKKQIDELINDPGLANAPIKLAAKVTALVQEHLKNSGSAMDAAVIADNVQDSIIAAGSKIDLMKFFTDVKKKIADGSMTMGDLGQILEGRHFARYQALISADLGKLKAMIEKEADGYTANRYQIMLKGIVGPVYELSAAVERLAVALGQSVFKDMAVVLTILANSINGLSQANPAMLKFATYTGMLVAALAPAGLIVAGLWAGLKAVAGIIGVVAGVGAAIVTSPVWATVAAVATALVAAGAAAYYYWDQIKAGADAFANKFIELKAKLIEFVTTLPQTLATAAGSLFEAGSNLLNSLWEGMKAKFTAILGWAAGVGSSIKSALGFGGAAPAGGAPAGGTPPGRALGGNVTRGRAYVVGERGRELFFPGQSGTIHPRAALGAAGAGSSISLGGMHFSISGASDPQAVADKAYGLFESRVRELFRGLQADPGLTFA